jgi:predicted dehydrogenase
MKLKTAIVGLGKMGLLHTSILSTLPNVLIVAVCEKSELITKFAKKIFNKIHIVKDIKLLSDFDLDLIYVTTPIPSHFKIVEFVFSHDIARNVFVEKTLASSSIEASKLYQLARISGGINMVGYERRYAVTFNKAHELLHQGVIGNLTLFKAYAYSSDFIGLRDKEAAKASASRGGLLRDLGAHVVDLALWYFGDLRVISSELKRRHNVAFEEAVKFNVWGVDGLEGCIEASWCMHGYRMPEVGLTIEGSKGVLHVSDDKVEFRNTAGSLVKWYRHDLKDNVEFLLGASEYYRESKHFIECVAKGSSPEPSFFTASRVEQIIDQVKKS